MSNVLDLVDQTMFFGERATGTTSVLQCVWVYNRAIDIARLRQFHDQLQHGRLSRLVEPSPLPFGRHRWVASGCSTDFGIIAAAQPREEFGAWLDGQANTLLDAERGPGWHLAALPFTDGGTGLSLVISHCLTDGVGLCEALADAACGRSDPVTWPIRGSRPLRQALREDAGQATRDLPSICRAAVATARLAQRSRDGAEAGVPATAKPPARPDERITIPMATIFVDADQWDARAHALGGTSNTLLAGLAARLAQRAQRLAADGSVALTIPINERIDGDTRANAVTNVNLTINPAPATTDLREIRAAIKQALIHRRDTRDRRWALLHVIPIFPEWLFRRMVNLAAASPIEVSSSNIGVVNPAANRPDGTDADYFAVKSRYPGMTAATMHRVGGRLQLLSGRVLGRVFVSVLAYQAGSANSNDVLQHGLSSTLTEFALTATTDWAYPEPVGEVR